MKPLIDHLLMHSIRTDGPFVLRSGATSSWYLDARQTTFSGEGAALVGSAVLSVLDDRVTAIGGMTMGADPIAVATALTAHERGRALRSFSIRKEAKDHGVGGRLVGPIDEDDVVAVLEDTATTGGAMSEAVEILESAGLVVVQAVVLVDRSGGAAARLMGARGIPFVALLQPSDLGMDLEME
jgi:orotate phosphoribosyltransferase